jgi:signal transduction histidine kinase
MEIHIIDSGCGISKENLGKLFMNFGRLEEHTKMNHRGTGLGLSICKSLIEMMGGSVTVESEVDVGTTFIIHFQTKCKVRQPKLTMPAHRDSAITNKFQPI